MVLAALRRQARLRGRWRMECAFGVAGRNRDVLTGCRSADTRYEAPPEVFLQRRLMAPTAPACNSTYAPRVSTAKVNRPPAMSQMVLTRSPPYQAHARACGAAGRLGRRVLSQQPQLRHQPVRRIGAEKFSFSFRSRRFRTHLACLRLRAALTMLNYALSVKGVELSGFPCDRRYSARDPASMLSKIAP